MDLTYGRGSSTTGRAVVKCLLREVRMGMAPRPETFSTDRAA
jgi:hypothetical protein